MYRKILAPLDGSKLGECTIGYIKEIARGCNVPKIIFLSVVEKNYDFSFEAAYPDLIRYTINQKKAAAEKYLSAIVAEMKKDGFDAESVVLEGVPANEIIDYANKNGVDFIVMSTHGRSGILRYALGSVTDKVIKSVWMPVMVVAPAGCHVKIR